MFNKVNLFFLSIIIIIIFKLYHFREFYTNFNSYSLIEKDYTIPIPSLDITPIKKFIRYNIIKENLELKEYEIEQILNNFFNDKNYTYVKIISYNKSLIEKIDIENIDTRNFYMYEIVILIKQDKYKNIIEKWKLKLIKSEVYNLFEEPDVFIFQKEIENVNFTVKGYFDFLKEEYGHFRIKNQLGLFDPYRTSEND